MSKQNKKPLSKAVGEWDNGTAMPKEIEETYNCIKNAIKRNTRYGEMIKSNTLQINKRGSAAKNNANSFSDDVDIHADFMGETDLRKEKRDLFILLKNKFGKANVKRHNHSIEILKGKIPLNVDLVPCRQEDGAVQVWNDKEEQEEPFYPTMDQRKIAERNDLCNGTYSQMVRAFKNVRTQVYKSFGKPYHISSHVIECLLFLVKTRTYKRAYDDDPEVNNKKRFIAIEQIVSAMLSDENAMQFKEINGKKNLFQGSEELKAVKEFWSDVHVFLTQNYDLER